MKTTPKDFFLWIGAMIALYFSVGSFIKLLFEYIDRFTAPTALLHIYSYSGGMRFALASMIVLFPVYIVLMRLLQKDIRLHPEKKELWVRKWLIILTIFAAGAGMLIDLIVLLITFLGGELVTIAFFLKVLTVFLVFSSVFYYYIQDVRGEWEKNEKASKNIGYAVGFMVLVGIVGSFFVMGSPAQQRAYRFDKDRISALQNIQSTVEQYYREKGELPKSISELKDPLLSIYIPTDPETGKEYSYEVVDATHFKICATFSLPFENIAKDTPTKGDWRLEDLKRTAQDWSHKAGDVCFTRTVDPKRIAKPLPVK